MTSGCLHSSHDGKLIPYEKFTHKIFGAKHPFNNSNNIYNNNNNK